jgi:ribose/xylose/arabinose/galactoside ABC-type transport system permease subunit
VFIVWNGLGCLVVPICIIGGVVAAAIADFEPNVRWPRLIAVLGTALAIYGLGLILNRKQVVGRDQWGNEVTATGTHSLYWIPVQYWSAIVLVAGTIFVFKK